MSEIIPNFDEILERLPEGTYKANIVDAEVKVSQKGNQYIKWRLTIFGADDARCNGKPVWTNTMTSGKAADQLLRFHKAATGENLRETLKPGEGYQPNPIMGKQVQITVIDGIDQEGNKTGFSEVKAVRALA